VVGVTGFEPATSSSRTAISDHPSGARSALRLFTMSDRASLGCPVAGVGAGFDDFSMTRVSGTQPDGMDLERGRGAASLEPLSCGDGTAVTLPGQLRYVAQASQGRRVHSSPGVGRRGRASRWELQLIAATASLALWRYRAAGAASCTER
jgi:hypothetical protein